MRKLFKKGSGGGGVTGVMAIIGVIAAVIIVVLLYSSIRGDCRSDAQCGEGRYCGVDRQCHAVPVIERTVEKNSFLMPALVLAAAMIISTGLFSLSRARSERATQDYYHNYYQNWYQTQMTQTPPMPNSEHTSTHADKGHAETTSGHDDHHEEHNEEKHEEHH